jgi:hypothetical protein
MLYASGEGNETEIRKMLGHGGTAMDPTSAQAAMWGDLWGERHGGALGRQEWSGVVKATGCRRL